MALQEPLARIVQEQQELRDLAKEGFGNPERLILLEHRFGELSLQIEEVQLKAAAAKGAINAIDEATAKTAATAEALSTELHNAGKGFAGFGENAETLAKQLNLAFDPAVKLTQELEKIRKAKESGKLTEIAFNAAVLKTTEGFEKQLKALKKLTPEQERLNKLHVEAKAALEALKSPAQQYTDSLAQWQELLDANKISQAEYTQLAEEELRKLTEANQRAAEESSNAWNDFANDVREVFVQTFARASGDLDDFLDRVKQSFKEAGLRQLFDGLFGTGGESSNGKGIFGSLFSNNGGGGGSSSSGGGILNVIGSLFGGGGGSSSGGSSSGGGGILNSLGSLFGGGGSGTSGSGVLGTFSDAVGLTALGNAYGAFTGGSAQLVGNVFGHGSAIAQGYGTAAGNLYASSYGVGTTLGFSGPAASAAGGLTTAGFGYAGGLAGNKIGETILNKQAESNIGSSAGGVAGAYIGASSAALGAAYGSWAGPIGALIGAAIGALVDVATGGDGKKRSNTGILQGFAANVNSRYTDVGLSGLPITAYSRRGSEQGAVALQDIALQIDEALTSISRANGLDIDFSNTTLAGKLTDAGHDGVGPFFGAKGFNGKGTLEGAADEFTRAWIDEIEHLLPERVQQLVSKVEQTAEGLVTAFEVGFSVDHLLNLDVVRETEEALDSLLDSFQETKTLFEVYEELSNVLDETALGLDSNIDSLREMSTALAEQKTVAAQLASAYRLVGLETDELLGNTIQSLRQSLLTEEELYNERRDQIADLNNQLSQALSPEEISRLTNEIVNLTNTTLGALGEDQQRALTPETIEFLEGVRETSQSRVDEGLAQLAAREDTIREIVELELAGADTFKTSVDDFATIIDGLSGRTIDINFPGGSGTITLADLFGIDASEVEVNA